MSALFDWTTCLGSIAFEFESFAFGDYHLAIIANYSFPCWHDRYTSRVFLLFSQTPMSPCQSQLPRALSLLLVLFLGFCWGNARGVFSFIKSQLATKNPRTTEKGLQSQSFWNCRSCLSYVAFVSLAL